MEGLAASALRFLFIIESTGLPAKNAATRCEDRLGKINTTMKTATIIRAKVTIVWKRI